MMPNNYPLFFFSNICQTKGKIMLIETLCNETYILDFWLLIFGCDFLSDVFGKE